MPLNLKQLIKREKGYVELEGHTTVKGWLGIERIRGFVYYFAQKCPQFGKIIPPLTRLRKHIYDLYFKIMAGCLFFLMVSWRTLHKVFARIAITIPALIASTGLLYLPNVHKIVDDFKSLEGILPQLGATFGTILALVLTLSIIPIQRAGEVWSPSIVRLYRRDLATHVLFVTLGIFCIACFIFAVRGIAGINVSVVLAGAMVMLGIGLDLLRWYHGHICQLLDPIHAVGLEFQRAKQTIDRTQAHVTRVSRLYYRGLNPKSQKEITVEDVETAFYQRAPGYPNSINFWINELGEIATKALSRGEKTLSRTAVFNIAGATNHYLSARKDNLVIIPSPEAMFLSSESDVKAVTGPAYEILHGVGHAAVSQGDEPTALCVSEAYQSIAIHISNLGARAYPEHVNENETLLQNI
jgi:hypothetical protein